MELLLSRPGRVETATLCELTDLGRSLDLPLAALSEWVGTNWQSVEAARWHWDQLPRARRLIGGLLALVPV
jgi:hypothetical protein